MATRRCKGAAVAGHLGSHAKGCHEAKVRARTWAPIATQPATTSEARTWYDTGDRAMILADGRSLGAA